MSIKVNPEKHYQKFFVRDFYEVKLEIDLNTMDIESISQSCCEEPFSWVEFSVNLNGKKILGELWFHPDHNSEKTLEYGISLYEVKSFSLNIELKIDMIGKDECQVQRYDRLSNSVTRLFVATELFDES